MDKSASFSGWKLRYNKRYMKDRNIYIGGAIVIALIIGIWAWNRAEVPQVQVPAGQETVFENSSGEKLSVFFDNQAGTASIDGILLTQTESASGARYVNETEGLEFWNKGIEATFSKGEAILFQGRTTADAQVGDKLLYVFAGPTWVWQQTQMGDGTVTTPKKLGEYTITFDSTKGRVIGETDCNGFGGTYTSGAGNTLAFGPFMSTLMYCEGSQEAEFTDLVMNSYRYIFSESGDLVLILKDEAGAVIFKRQ